MTPASFIENDTTGGNLALIWDVSLTGERRPFQQLHQGDVVMWHLLF